MSLLSKEEVLIPFVFLTFLQISEKAISECRQEQERKFDFGRMQKLGRAAQHQNGEGNVERSLQCKFSLNFFLYLRFLIRRNHSM